MSDALRARPTVPADVLAAIRAAAEQVVADERAEVPLNSVWRFSGRWFSAHPIRGRSRPG